MVFPGDVFRLDVPHKVPLARRMVAATFAPKSPGLVTLHKVLN